MPVLDAENIPTSTTDLTANRICPVTVKLTQEEHRLVTEYANGLGQARSEWMRNVILQELHSPALNDPALAEILGVRLLLVNVLRPVAAGQKITPEAFDKLLDEIGNTKHDLARKLATEGRK